MAADFGQLRELSGDVPPARAALAMEMRYGREKANLSLQDLAQCMYSSKATVSRWLNAKAMPDEKQAIDWAEQCGTDVAVMTDLWRRARSDAVTEAPSEPPQGLRRVRVLAVIAVAAIAVVTMIVLLNRGPQRPPCALDYPIALYVPAQSGEVMDVTVEVKCTLDSQRKHFVVEEVPNVDLRNPHPAYYVKARIVRTRLGESSVLRMILKEPVGLRAKFYVISVDAAGERALEQNRVVDDGLLDLPEGTRQESTTSWHVKAWQ